MEPRCVPRKLVLCFDGTGNKFKGDDSDSNILKIFRCLDRTAGKTDHYYQPGIGTYVISQSLSHTSIGARLRSWYLKAKDSAIGSSFDQHVVGGYRFLMRFYSPGDEIYFFGFSRGAYVARFLAEMLDYVGLLSHGNEEMVVFAWKAFSHWQSRRTDPSEEGEREKREMYRYMKGFRETFSRPVKRVRFLGLFDTVNSVPRFETAWMQRSKFPYTARSSAKVIRHCVSIDERRAKFRQDLIYQVNGKEHKRNGHGPANKTPYEFSEKYRARRAAVSGPSVPIGQNRGRRETLAPPEEQAFRPRSRSKSRTTRGSASGISDMSHAEFEYDSDSENEGQDIDEIWFAGGHGDVGGGWEFIEDCKSASHIPLTYMIREAQRAGLHFDPEKLADMGCSAPHTEASAAVTHDGHLDGDNNETDGLDASVPDIRIAVSSPSPGTSPIFRDIQSKDWSRFHYNHENADSKPQDGYHQQNHESTNPFHQLLYKAHVACIHDSLEFSSGLSITQVLSWKLMEYLPFRRMDLKADGSWRPIRWPLPCGEVRDMPHTARVHGSVIRRMREDEGYRPGNLIVGGGGRGMRRAPRERGCGEWVCVAEAGDPVGEVW
ncbi:uncharacterized protein BCR38DRAFT_355945 [Pseudomassariella vexata]|uniref:T6SS Phospholipase effector Tle1-like catalytic domain-containing protein n=1 Tax=Pseudomassariella vexata TaxID=1141098 RepID=A0A1Y2DAQ4_9PEZI|nr:uncharacterized protein BCR38DRAFT_355945 [Pseudomassariella vexata]ORY56352.1 hypothetical protein BCR38DRAFT_355945 [Pseudomassariella vexata]